MPQGAAAKQRGVKRVSAKRRIPYLKRKSWRYASFEAEGKGFEPLSPCGLTVFKTAAIDHSANLPDETGLQR